MSALGLMSKGDKFAEQLQQDNQKLLQYLPQLEVMANDSSSSNTFRNFIQYLKSGQ
jgi:hypothetical protein